MTALTPAATVELLMPIRTASLANEHRHWRARQKRAKAERKETWACCRSSFLRPLRSTQTATVYLTRVGPQLLDDDNLPTSMKSIRDQLAVELGVDDRSPRIVWRYAQDRGTYAVRVRVEIQGGEEP